MKKLKILLIIMPIMFFTCKKSDIADGVNIKYFMASPATIPAYGKTTLSWEVERSLLIILSGAGETTVVPAIGSIDIVPGKETIYTLHAIGPEDSVDERQLTVKVDLTSPCDSLYITGHTGTRNGVTVELSPNQNIYYSAKNVVVEVKLYNDSGGVMEVGTATIAEIAPGINVDVFVRLSKAGKQARTECAIVDCNCDYTMPK